MQSLHIKNPFLNNLQVQDILMRIGPHLVLNYGENIIYQNFVV